MKTVDLSPHGVFVSTVLHNPSPSQLYEEAIRREKNTAISDTGALIAYSGDKTGRSPKDKRVVKHPESERDVWWGPVNFPLPESIFMVNRERATDYLNTQEVLYCIDGYAGWDPDYRIRARVICSRPYHALFMHNMLIRPTRRGTREFRRARLRDLQRRRQFPANRYTSGMTSRTTVDLSLEAQGNGHPGHGLRRRDEEGRVHADELPDAEAGSAVDALLGDGLEGDGSTVGAVRPLGHRQDDAVRRPQAVPHRRRRALLERQRHLQYRGRLLRQGDLS